MHNLLVAQSGGPTAAINATVVGVLQAAKTSGKVDKVYGGVNGIQGIMSERFLELDTLVADPLTMEALAQTPAAALGSCRFKLSDPKDNPQQYEQLIRIFRKYEISYFIYIGGNDSMDTVDKLSKYCMAQGIDDIKVMGAPKTIDNDLVGTDHCPGFGSAAKYIATTFTELERDISVYHTSGVTIVEIMGRNAGWLTAASALSRLNGDKGPDLIYLCERPFSMTDFLYDVKEKLEETGTVIVAVSEGIKDDKGNYISDITGSKTLDVFGHKYIAGAGKALEGVIRQEIGCKVRSIEFNLMQRCASHIASLTDLSESRLLGMKAVSCAVEGRTGEMTAMVRRTPDTYDIEFVSVPVCEVANAEKKVPDEWINEEGNDVTEDMINYLKPLIQGEPNTIFENGIPKHVILYNRK